MDGIGGARKNFEKYWLYEKIWISGVKLSNRCETETVKGNILGKYTRPTGVSAKNAKLKNSHSWNEILK